MLIKDICVLVIFLKEYLSSSPRAHTHLLIYLQNLYKFEDWVYYYNMWLWVYLFIR